MMRASSRIACAAGLALSSTAFAQTWDGGGADNNWNTALNWNGNVIPVNNGTATVVLGGAVDPTPIVNVNYSILGLDFAAGAAAFALGASGGSVLTIGSGGIDHSTTSVTHSISAPITVAAAQSWNTIAPLAVSGAVTVNAPLTLNMQTASSAGTFTISNVWTGAGLVTKTGAGRIFLGNDLATTGGFTLNGGEVFLQTSNVLPDTGLVNVVSGTLSLNGQADGVGDLAGNAAGIIQIFSQTLQVTQATDRVLASQVTSTASGQFTKTGPANLTISNFTGFLGDITIAAGTLTTSGNEVIANTVDMDLNGNCQFVVNGTETVATVAINSTGGSLTGSGSLSHTGLTITSNVTTQINIPTSGIGSFVKSGTGIVQLNAPTSHTGGTSISDGRVEQVGSEFLSDAASLNVAGAGRYELLGVETVGGLNGSGIVELQSNSQFTTSSGNFSGFMSGSGLFIKVGAGTLSLTGDVVNSQGIDVRAGRVNASADLLSSSVQLKVSGGTYAASGSDTMRNVLLQSGTIEGVGPLTFTLDAVLESGTISCPLVGSAFTSLIKQTAGTVVMSGDNSGVQTRFLIDGGTVEISRDNNLGAPGFDAELSGATLRMTAPMTLNRPLLCDATGGTLDCLSNVTLAGIPTFLGPITKTGGGRLTFAGGAPTGGSMTIAGGEVKFGADAAVQFTGALTLQSAGICALSGGLLTASSVSNAGSLTLIDDARIVGPVTNSGTLEGDGRIQGALVNQISGEIWVNSGDRFWVNSASTSTNSGIIDVMGGELIFDGPVVNAASTGLIYSDDAVLRFRGGLTNSGSMLVSLGEKSVFGDITNNAGGTIVISGGRSATFVDDVVNNGQIRTSAGGTSVFGGAMSGAGTFPGTGTVYFEGDLRPGNSPANVTFGGSVVLGGASNTHIELGGLVAGSQHDKMTVAAQISLDGALDVSLINGFVPGASSTFTIVQAASVVGEFASVSKPRGMRVSYEPNRVRLIYCPADFNEDSAVDFFDYLDFVDAFSANLDTADFNGDTSIDFFDYLDFVDAFSTGC